MKTLAYILFFLICTILALSCSPNTHNCARKAQELRKANRGNTAQFAHYFKK